MDPLTLAPDTTALLVVDVQERLITAMPAYDARRLTAAVELLIDAAAQFRVPVLLTEQYPRGLGPTVPSIRAAIEACDPKPVTAEKTVFSAMDPPAISRALSAGGARSIVLVGMEAHVCVFQTARDLRARGYFVHVPFDAVASRDPACRQTALAQLARHGVTVTTTETVVFDLLRDAKHPAFKSLSTRVKNLPMPG